MYLADWGHGAKVRSKLHRRIRRGETVVQFTLSLGKAYGRVELNQP